VTDWVNRAKQYKFGDAAGAERVTLIEIGGTFLYSHTMSMAIRKKKNVFLGSFGSVHVLAPARSYPSLPLLLHWIFLQAIVTQLATAHLPNLEPSFWSELTPETRQCKETEKIIISSRVSTLAEHFYPFVSRYFFRVTSSFFFLVCGYIYKSSLSPIRTFDQAGLKAVQPVLKL
jgi:hypothetical protein